MREHAPRPLVALALALSALALPAGALGADRIVVTSSGTTSLRDVAGTVGSAAGPARLEWRGPKRLGSSPLRTDPLSAGPELEGAPAGARASAARRAKSHPELLLDWEGVNHRDSRLAFGGNQFSGEPADQGLCVGNGYVLESVNSALRVYDADTGAPVTPVAALNEFYGFPPAIDRSTFTFGPFTFDISCHYDPDTDRWFHLAVDLDQDPATGAFTGKNYLDLAVSHSGDPTGDWTIYRIPGMNDGTEGTPDHDCPGGPCFADFPHIGVDKHGVYVTTNEFPLFESGFTGAQVYALSKRELVSRPMSIGVTLFNTGASDYQVRPGEPGFTLWPALVPGRQFAGDTQYFVSSNAVFDDVNADSEELVVWALTNTRSLDSASPSLELVKTIVPVGRYAVPGNSPQKAGTYPLGECLNDTEGSFFGVNCGLGIFGLPPQSLPVGPLDSGDSRVLDTRYANGKLWAVLGTSVQVGSPPKTRVGVGWYILDPNASSSRVSARLVKQGILALEDENLIYPTLGVTESGRGVMGFSIVSENSHPSVGYAPIDALAGAGPVGLVEAGNAPQDGFTEYPPIGGNRPRWGDYGAAAVDGPYVYLAGQYIEQGPCDLEEFIGTGFQCDDVSRVIFANWSTRVSKLRP